MSAAVFDSPPPVDDPTAIPLPELRAMLRRWARGIYPGEAAVELLIAHDRWLRRRDFLTRCVFVCDRWDENDPVMAGLDWSQVAAAVDPAGSIQPGEGFPASASEIKVLAVVASLAGAPLRQSLRDLIVGLDVSNTRRVLDAVAHAGGWHEHQITATITGTVGRDGDRS